MVLRSLTMLLLALPVAAQIDQQRAAGYFKEAAALCEREAGKLWGVSLCGPMLFVDPASRVIVANQAAPAATLPESMPIANTAVEWEGMRWTMVLWPSVPLDEYARARLMLHELWHRVQPKLGLMQQETRNEHLDTLEGRYWAQLEWRALDKALASAGPERLTALRDALAFRAARRKLAPAAAADERAQEMNEGLAQYTATVAASNPAQAIVAARDELKHAALKPSFVRTFGYASGTAYGVLLDGYAPGWTHTLKPADDLGRLLKVAAHVPVANDPLSPERYDGAALMASEAKREREHQAQVDTLKKRLVDGPVLVLPLLHVKYSFQTNGLIAIPGQGTVYPVMNASDDWGLLDVSNGALFASDRSKLAVSAPTQTDSKPIVGDGWTLKLAAGWILKQGPREGDLAVVRETLPSK